MVYLTRRKKKGKVYLYLEESARINGKPRRVWQIYLGPEERLKEKSLSGLFTKHLNNIKISTLDFGISAALWKIAENVGLASIIDSHTKKKREQGLTVGEYITIAAINRCCKPVSKSQIGNWFKKDWLSTCFDVKTDTLNSQTYWNHFKYFDEKILDNIELSLNKVIIAKYDLDLNNLFYDPTNFFTYSAGTGNEGLLQFGHSKQNRNGNRLVNYTLLCARDSGIPLMHKTYSGNEQDANRFKSAPEEIKKRLLALNCEPSKVTLVFDKGNHSKEAFKAIDDYGFGFIASARNSTQKPLLHIPRDKLSKLVLPVSGKVVEYIKKTKLIYGQQRSVFVVLDPKKQKKHTTHFKEKLEDKIAEINEFFKDRLNIKKWRKKEAVDKKIKKIIGRNPFKSIILFDIQGNDSKLSFKLVVDKQAQKEHTETLGRTILFTNRNDWSPESIIWGYREQYIVEHAFRKMKSPTSISIRPMYHYSDRSIRVHVYICVLSLMLLSLLRLELSRLHLSLSYNEILENLGSAHILKIQTSPKGKILWKLDNPGKTASRLVKKLELKSLLEF
jgi:transposase